MAVSPTIERDFRLPARKTKTKHIAAYDAKQKLTKTRIRSFCFIQKFIL